MGRITFVALLPALALLLALPAASVGNRSFHDELGDVYCRARDLTGVTVGNDDAGTITFAIRITSHARVSRPFAVVIA